MYIKDDACCGCNVENKPSYDELKRQLDNAYIQLHRKANLIEGLERTLITNTIRIRDLEVNIDYWKETYYKESERANDYYNRLKALQESNKEDKE